MTPRPGRIMPYTKIGIRRVPCTRCGRKPSVYQWQICAAERRWTPLCRDCDVLLNRLILDWIGDPEADAKMARYEARV
jgi:hypothetical protein